MKRNYGLGFPLLIGFLVSLSHPGCAFDTCAEHADHRPASALRGCDTSKALAPEFIFLILCYNVIKYKLYNNSKA